MTELEPQAFEFAEGFVPSAELLGIELGPLEMAYQELFADVLADGVITQEERMVLEKAAARMGLDRERLAKLEQAMMTAFEAHHRVRVVEQYERPTSPPPAATQVPGTEALLARIHELETHVRDLEEELRRAQSSINVEIDITDLEPGEEVSATDVENAWRKVRRDPANPEALRELAQALEATGDTDRRLFVAQALCVLGEASAEDKRWVAEHSDTTLPKPSAGLSQTAWNDQLLHPDQEVTTGNIFGVIAPAVLLGKVAALGRDHALYKPTPDQRQDPAQTTLTAVRALAWSAAVLGVGTPVVIVDPKCEGSYVHTPALPPMTLVAHSALSGRAQRELAFMAGRHLTMYRAEHYVRALFPSVPDLEDLFLAAITLGNPSLPLAVDVKHRVGPIASALEPLLQPAQIDALRGYLLRFVEEGGRTNLQRWGAAVDKTACRAGLLLCGDLTTAAGVLKAEEGPNGELLRDLIAFATSEAHSKLRHQLGIGLAN
jgi:hypothetical protein